MRIIIDMQGAQTESRYRGIGRYTLSLVLAIIRNNREHEIVLALNGLFTDTIEPIRTLFDGLIPQENIRVWYTTFPTREAEIGNEQRQRIAKQIREAFLISLQPDIVLISSLFEGWSDDAVTDVGTSDGSIPFATILYDLIPLINPDQSVKSNVRLQEFYQNKADSLKRSNGFLAISASARQEALDNSIGSEELIYNISTACDDIFQKISLDNTERKKLLKKLGIAGSFIMYTGGSDERKNLYRLIEAYAKLPDKLRKAHKLVFVGRMPREYTESFLQLAKTVGIDKGGLVFTGYVSEDELVKLYNCCKLFVFPSLHEGFGLPPLEAMACGAPVIVANATSLPEVAACTESMFDPYSVESIKHKIEHVLTDDTFCSALIEKGLEHVKTFSWDESARKALEMLQRTFNNHQRAASRNDLPENSDQIISRLITSIASGNDPKLADNQRAMVAQAIALSIPAANSTKKLFVDISNSRIKGVKTENQQIADNILQALLENLPTGYSVIPVYAQVSREGYLYAEDPFHINAAEIVATPIEFSAGDIFLGLAQELQVVPVQQGFFQLMRNNGVIVKFIVYDLLRLSMPKNYTSGSVEIFTDWLTSITHSDGVICLSEEVSQQFTVWLHKQKKLKNERFKVDWFQVALSEHSPDLTSLSLEHKALKNAASQRPTFIMVGTLEPGKGYHQVLSAFKLLWSKGLDINLIIVGNKGWMADKLVNMIVRNSEINQRLFWLEDAQAENSAAIYSLANCLICANEGDGSGFPLLTAIRYHLPVIARDIPVFKEIAGDKAFYFSGTNVKELASTIQQWLLLFQQNKAPLSDGIIPLTSQQSTAMLLQAISPKLKNN